MTTALVLCLVLIPTAALLSRLFGAFMKRASVGQRISQYAPRLHANKVGTATMGGMVIVLLWAMSMLVLYVLGLMPRHGAFVLASGALFGSIGFLDDLLSLHHRRSLGLSPLQKVILVTCVSAFLFFLFPEGARAPVLVPFSMLVLNPSPFWAFVLALLVFLGTTNGLNLTDGLDGLAAGITLLVLVGYVFILRGADIGISIVPLCGIIAGFLWVNTHPASLFLGDTGSFALGGILAALALASGTALVLPILAGVVVLEAGSVILQVCSYRLTGTRVFKVTPLHHHFEYAEGIDYPYLIAGTDWSEPKITVRFWVLQAFFLVLAMLAVRW